MWGRKKERNERLRKGYVICGLINFYPGDWITSLSKNNNSSRNRKDGGLLEIVVAVARYV